MSVGDGVGDTLLCNVLQIEKEEQAAAEKAVVKEEFQGEWSAPPAEFAQPEVADWAEGVAVPSVPIQQFPAGKISHTDSVRSILLMSNTLICHSYCCYSCRRRRCCSGQDW